MTSAGDLREQVEIQQQIETPDGAGGRAVSWLTVATVWAQVRAVSGREQIEAGALSNVQAWRVRIRWRSGIGITNRLVYRGTYLNVRSASDPDQRRQWLDILADSGQG